MNFAQTLLNWYHHHKRDLPWRSTSDPYIIWLSEVILQQTRVEQGLPYFHKFVDNYPRVQDFAAATEEDILKHWQGLGYYSRGRNMHKTAQIVMEEHAGYFPTSYEHLIKLKGIGEYTAAAISSFAANEAKAVVDGNVFRLLARYFGIDEPINTPKGKRIFTEIANQLIDNSQPGTYNQAAMEFGALQCKPRNPNCEICPLKTGCSALNEDRVNELPVKLKTPGLKSRYFNYLVFAKNRQILMQKRVGKDIWHNLHEFPLVETNEHFNAHKLICQPDFIANWGSVKLKTVSGPVKHLLSHQKIHAQFIELEASCEMNIGGAFWIDIEQANELAQPKLIFDYFKKLLP